MQTAAAQKPASEKENQSVSAHSHESENENLAELGAEAGMPIFLKPAAGSAPTIGPPDDEYEREADQVAETVMRKPLDEDIRVKSDPLVARRIQPKANHPGAAHNNLPARDKQGKPSALASAVKRALHSGDTGSPVDTGVKGRIESTTGEDLGGVRVHNDTRSVSANAALRSRAFTHGNHIWLGRGESQSDVGLMAHEATHVIQQGATKGTPHIQRQLEGSTVPANPPAQSPSAAEPAQTPDSSTTDYSETGETDVGETESSPEENSEETDTEDTGDTGDTETQESETGEAQQDQSEGEETGEEQEDNGENETTEESSDGTSDTAGGPEADEGAVADGDSGQGGDLALIDFELAEHERWAGSFGEVGTAGSDERAQFILDQAGQGASSGAISGLGMGFVMGAVGGAVGQIAGRRLATLAVSRGASATPVPGLGSAIGGVMALAGLAMRDWGNTFDTIGRFGEGEGYAGLANDLEAIAEVLDLASNVADVIAGVLGGIAVGMWVGAILSAGTLSPLAASLSAVAIAINLATTAIGVIINVVIRPTVTALRALHAFESQGDPAQIEAEGQQLQAAAGQVTGAVAGAAGGRLGGAAGSRGGTRLDNAARNWQQSRSGGTSTTAGNGPQVHVDAPDSQSTSQSGLRPLDQGPHPVTPDVEYRGDFSDDAISVNTSGRRNTGQASVGDIGPHRLHGSRGNTMISEHVVPGAQVRDASRDPSQGGSPDWQRSTPGGSDGRDYNNATTIVDHAAVASRKTQADNAATAALQQGGNPQNLSEDLLLPSLERHQTAVDDAIAAGEITPAQATDPTHRALAAQAELWEGGGAGGGARARAEADASGTRVSNPRRADRRRAAEVQRRQDRLNADPEGVADFDDYDWDATFSHEPDTPTSQTSNSSAVDTNATQLNNDLLTGTMPIGGVGASQGRVAARDELVDQAQDEADPRRPQLGPAYTASVETSGLEPGTSLDIPINPAYPAPPGTTAELDALQEQIRVSRGAQDELETTEGLMETQAGEQQAQSEQLVEADGVTQDLQTGRTAHQSTTDSTLSTNSEQQSTASDTISNLSRGAEESAGLATLVTSLRGFQGLAHLFSYLPGSLGRSAERAGDDAEGLITSLNRVTETEAVQSDVTQGQATMEANQTAIEGVGEQGQETDTELDQGQQGVTDLSTANDESLQETEATLQQATQERGQAEASEEESQSAHDQLLGELQTWANEHRQAREDAIQSAIEAYNEQGYQASDASD